MKQLDTLNPGEAKVPLTFEFADYLAPGETIASAVIDVDLWNNGVDATPADLIDGSPVLIDTNTTVLQRVTGATAGARTTGGLDGCDYRVRCRATTTGVLPARVIALVSLLPVRNA